MARESEMIRNGGGLIDVTLHSQVIFCYNGKIPVPGGEGGLRCLALTSMSRRLLHRRYDMRGGEGNAAWQRCEEGRILRLLEMT